MTDPAGLVGCEADFCVNGWADAPSRISFSWVTLLSDAAPYIDLGAMFYDFGKSFGLWGQKLQFNGNVKASQNGKNVPNQKGCPNGYQDATPQEEQEVLKQARSQIGRSYDFGGGASSCPANGFDCSGLVSWSINSAGFQYGPTGYINTIRMRATPFLRFLGPRESQRPGDIMLFTGHTGFYDPSQSAKGDFLSATVHSGVAYSSPQYFGNPAGQFKYMRLQVCK